MATVLFVSPHQDDDTISMGVAGRDHAHAVHVLLLTPVETTAVRTELAMDVADFVAARDDELLRATRQVGVRTANVHISPDRVPDGTLTADAAQAMVAAFLDDNPGAWVKSYSDLDVPGKHLDHLASGQAVRALLVTGVVTNWRCYVEPWLLFAFRTANPGVTVGTERVSDNTGVLRGFAQYQVQDHVAGMYGIGYLSVGAEFAENTPPLSYYHVP